MREKYMNSNLYLTWVFVVLTMWLGAMSVICLSHEEIVIIGLFDAVVCLGYIVVILIYISTPCTFYAKDYMVTFHTPFIGKESIKYRDIKDVWITRSCNVRRFGKSTWTETIHFRLENETSEFSAQMNIDLGSADLKAKTLTEQMESSNFTNLKNFIEEKLIIPNV